MSGRVSIIAAAILVSAGPLAAGDVVMELLKPDGENLLKADAWRPWQKGFARDGDRFVCANGTDRSVQRGVSQTVVLNQAAPHPIVATCWSRAEGVGGSANSDYSLYLDLVYTDGTPLWGQVSPFKTGTHDWQRVQVTIFPAKPVRSLSFHMLLRRHTGKAWFKDPKLAVLKTPKGAAMFDGVPVRVKQKGFEGFLVRDVAAGSAFVAPDGKITRGKPADVLGLRIEDQGFWGRAQSHSVLALVCLGSHIKVLDLTGEDRAVTLYYVVQPYASRPEASGVRWLADPRCEVAVKPPQEYLNAPRAGSVGANGLMSRYPLAAVARGDRGTAICLDLAFPAFYRVGYSAGTGLLYIAFDLALVKEKPTAVVRFATFGFDAAWGFRGAVAEMYEIFPDHFKCRTPEMGLWMPFHKTSTVKGWQDFGFKFKEGTNETAWDDAHGLTTFRYTEPMTWWMRMPKGMPRTIEAATAEAHRLAEKNDRRAQAFLASGYHDESGRFPARLRDTPWCDGAVWSINSMPGVAGEVTDFGNKWSAGLRDRYYGPNRKGDLDGEYVDSSEGYVTDVLNFRRDHFAAARTPLVFASGSHAPAIFRGLIVFEYVRAIEKDVRAMGKLMMANGAPTRLPWLVPMLDVCGTETNWHRGGVWTPMSDEELLYRRVMCGPKPYCFLMNTRFEQFGPDLVERYMKRCLAYGMFPGFFSHNASQGHYFSRPELYDRDRPLFKQYVPLVKRVAEAGWRPVTLARSSDPKIYLERWGDRYLTVFNDSDRERTTTLTLDGRDVPSTCLDLVRGRRVAWTGKETPITLGPEDVALIDLAPDVPANSR